MKKIVASLLLLGSFSVAIAEPLNPTPEPVDQDTMHSILTDLTDNLKAQDFATWENRMVDFCEEKKVHMLVYFMLMNLRLMQTL